MNSNLSKSIVDKHIEVTYNEKTFKSNKTYVKQQLKGKIKCKVLNCKITPNVCSCMMDQKGWPRCIDPNICSKLGCHIHKSIERNSNKGK